MRLRRFEEEGRYRKSGYGSRKFLTGVDSARWGSRFCGLHLRFRICATTMNSRSPGQWYRACADAIWFPAAGREGGEADGERPRTAPVQVLSGTLSSPDLSPRAKYAVQKTEEPAPTALARVAYGTGWPTRSVNPRSMSIPKSPFANHIEVLGGRCSGFERGISGEARVARI